MAQLVIGAAISFAVGIATNLLISLLTPAQKIEGQRLNDLTAPKSNWGSQIPWVWGTVRIAGNIIWADDIKEVITKKRRGGKGLGPKVVTTEYSYYGSFAVLLCKGPILGIRRLWLNSKLVVNLDANADAETRQNSLNFLADNVRIYTGSADQMPDPLLQTKLGIENTPAYRNRAYLVLDDLALTEDYGSQFPTVTAEVVTCGTVERPGAANLAGIVYAICKQVGLNATDLELGEIAGPVTGYWINSAVEAREHLGELQQVYFYDVMESQGRIKFISKQRPAIAQRIPIVSLAAHEYGQNQPQRFTEKRKQETELPQQITLKFLDPNVEYREAAQRSPLKAGTWSRNAESITVPVVLTASQGKTIADKLLFLAWVERKSFELNLLPQNLLLEPGDLIDVPFHGVDVTVKLTKVGLGANLLMQCEAVAYDPSVFNHQAIASQAYSEAWTAQEGQSRQLQRFPLERWDSLTSDDGSVTYRLGLDYSIDMTLGVVRITNNGLIDDDTMVRANYYAAATMAVVAPVKVPGMTELHILDVPAITDDVEDFGLYALATGGGNWRNGALYGSTNNGARYDFVLNFLTKSTIGTCETVLGASSPFVMDEISVLRVQMRSGELESCTLTELLQGENTAVVGQEVIRFLDAVLVAPRTYELKRLIRGVRGTEWAIESHVPSESIYVMTDYFEDVKGSRGNFGVPLLFKAVSSGQSLDEVTAIPSTPQQRLKPWAPVNIRGERDAAGNLTIRWVRRDRKGGELPLFLDPPMSEDAERYELEILNGSTVSRQVPVTVPQYVYSAADQGVDFGMAQALVTVRVYQMSALVGRGFAGGNAV
jgi:hypothetical protein